MDETKIVAHSLAKQYRQIIFKGFNYTFSTPGVYGISGANGSGKSTLIQVLSGFIQASYGSVEYSINGRKLNYLEVARKIAFAAPYIQLIEELSVSEMVEFHAQYASLHQSTEAFLDNIYLSNHSDKFLNQLSSGMMQRLQLGLAFGSKDKSIIILDEPSSFLDERAKKWMEKKIEERKTDALIIIASNDMEDLGLCQTIIKMEDYKMV